MSKRQLTKPAAGGRGDVDERARRHSLSPALVPPGGGAGVSGWSGNNYAGVSAPVPGQSVGEAACLDTNAVASTRESGEGFNSVGGRSDPPAGENPALAISTLPAIARAEPGALGANDPDNRNWLLMPVGLLAGNHD